MASRWTWWSWARTDGCCGSSSRRCSTASTRCPGSRWCTTTCRATPTAPPPGATALAPAVAPGGARAAQRDGHNGHGGVSNDESALALDRVGGLRPTNCSTCGGCRPPSGSAPPSPTPTRRSSPAGYRLLHRLPSFPDALVDRIVEHFAGLQRILRTSVAELEEVEGVGEARARSVKEGLARLAEAEHPRPLQLRPARGRARRSGAAGCSGRMERLSLAHERAGRREPSRERYVFESVTRSSTPITGQRS